MMIERKTIRCRKIVKGMGEGEAIVSKDAICFYLVDPKTGIVIEKNHCLKGQTIANKVLVCSMGKGSSVVQIDGLYQLSAHNNAPRAIIVRDIDPVLVSAAVIMNVPLVHKLEENPFDTISTGDYVKVDADNESVKVVESKKNHSPLSRAISR